MTKIFEWLEVNIIKILMTIILTWGLFFGLLYIQRTTQELINTQSTIVNTLTSQNEVQEERFTLSIKGLLIIIQQLEDIAQSQQFIIDQNRTKAIPQISINNQEKSKPTYAELKSHNVYIEGCADKEMEEDSLNYPIGEKGMCWGGTGVVIKITDTETYILTNNHVSGEGQINVKLVIENGKELVPAEVVKHHPYVDAAVLKIQGKLTDKTAIKKITTAYIQDPVYVVGNPLSVRNIYTEGIIAGYEGVSILVQMPCIYGNSGSGVYNSKGELVGLVYALEVYPGFLGMPTARITHSLIVDGVSIKLFLQDLGLYNE